MHLTQIWTYPIKSCAGVALEHATLGERGLRYDRNWMVVTPAGQMVTLREATELIRVRSQFGSDHLEVSAPAMLPLELPYRSTGSPLQVKLWEGWVRATVIADASVWFSRYLNQDVRLVAVAENNRRTMNPDFGSRQLSFVDGNPLNILGEASLAELNSRLVSPAGVEQFRPNLVFAGGEAFAEDSWRQVRIGAVPFEVYEACQRCMVVNIATDETYSKAPLTTLATYRRSGKHVLFAQNINHLALGELKLGDELEVTEYAVLNIEA